MITENVRNEKLLEILSIYPSLILLLKNKYRSDEMWKVCLAKEPALFQYLNDPSDELCEFVLDLDGNNVKYLNDKGIRITKDMALKAIKSNPESLLNLPDNVKTKEIYKDAFDIDPSLMINYGDIDKDYLLSKIEENPANIQYVKNPDEDLICYALDLDPNTIVYVENFTPKILSIMATKYPEIAGLLGLTDNDLNGGEYIG